MKIVPFMQDETLNDGVYHLPDGRVFPANYLKYYRTDAVELRPVVACEAIEEKPLTVEILDSMIAQLLTQECLDNYGAQYVRRQVEWAEGCLQLLLAHELSSMAGSCGQVRAHAQRVPLPSQQSKPS